MLIFWICLVGLVLDGIFLSFLTEVENFGWATVTLIVTCVGLHFFHIVEIVPWVAAHALETVWIVLGYLFMGVVWSFVKWFSFLMAFRDSYRELRAEYFARKGWPGNYGMTFQEESSFLHDINGRGYARSFRGNAFGYKPKASDNKSRITAWMAFWPFSFIGTMINDPLRRVLKILFEAFHSLYQRMSDRVFANHPELK